MSDPEFQIGELQHRNASIWNLESNVGAPNLKY